MDVFKANDTSFSIVEGSANMKQETQKTPEGQSRVKKLGMRALDAPIHPGGFAHVFKNEPPKADRALQAFATNSGFATRRK